MSAKLGLDDGKPSWQLAGRRPQVVFTRGCPPPGLVTLATVAKLGKTEATVLEHIKAAQWHELLWGVGTYNGIVSTSINTESPHTGLSQPSGAGKSVDARSSLVQMLHHGAIGVVLDYKRFSHRWAQGLPNVAYCKTPMQIHRMLMWLAGDEDGRMGEIQRRNEVADASADIEGKITANVGPPIFVIVEELNATQRVLTRLWQRELRAKGDPMRSPASDALDEGLFIGRQVRVFFYLICQRGSVKAVSGAGGGGDARDNIGVWVMYDPSPATFRMIGWDHDLPPAAGHQGRKQIVTAHGVRESQNILMTGAEARALATAGTVAVPRGDMPFTGDRYRDVPDVPAIGGGRMGSGKGATVPDIPRGGPPGRPDAVTIKEAIDAGWFGDRDYEAVRKQLQRDSNAPSRIGKRGNAHTYDEEALYEYASR